MGGQLPDGVWSNTGLGATDGRRRGYRVAEMMMMLMMMILYGWSSSCLACSSVLLSLLCLLLSLLFSLRSNNYYVNAILFQTTRFLYPCIYQSSRASKSHPPTRFSCPSQSKNVVLYPKSRYLPIFDRFLPVKQSNMNRFRKGFHSRIAFVKLYNIAAQSLSWHELCCIKIIIETFLEDNRFPCVSSLVFEAITISISRDVLARRTEQYDTTHDSLGRKLTNLENCNFRSASSVLGRDTFFKIAITNPFFVRIQNGFDLLVGLSPL